MPLEAEDQVQDFVERYLQEQEVIHNFQLTILNKAVAWQNAPLALRLKPQQVVRQRMAVLNKATQVYFSKNFDGVYLAGARSIDPTFVSISPAARSHLARINTQEYLKLRAAGRQTTQDMGRFMEMVYNDREDRRRKLGTKYSHVEDVPERTIRIRGVKAMAYQDGKVYRIGDYGKMSINTNASRAYNLGAVHAAKAKNIPFLVVEDGPDCGWTYHDDPETAAGKVVTPEEALSYPLAHPNCRRTFRAATPKEIKEKDKKEKARRQAARARATKAAKVTGVVALGGLGAIQATNLLAAGTARFAESKILNQIIETMAQRAFAGDLQARNLVFRLTRFQDTFGADNVENGKVFLLRAPGLPPMSSDEATKILGYIYPNSPIPNIPSFEDIRLFADGFMEGLGVKDIPDKVKRALGAVEEEALERMGARFQAFYSTAKKAALSEDAGDNIRNVIDLEAKRRGAFEKIFSDLPGVPQLRASWSRWGPRIRVDVTDFLRGKITATPTGLIKSLTVNAAGQFRGAIKMYQDGTIGGHLSVLPKNFARGIFRAIVEVDENGRLIGNIRLVPGGPLRVRLEFATLGERTDLRDFLVSPLGAIGNAAESFRKFKFERLVLELRVFNQSIFDISANLRIPVDKIKEVVRALSKTGELRRNADGTVTGLFRYFYDNPRKVQELLGTTEDAKGVKGSVFGNLRFSSLTSEQVEASPFLRALRAGNVRLLTKAHIVNTGLQNIATNMRIHGWNIYDVANVLKLKWNQTRELIVNGLYRVKNFAEDLGVLTIEDLLPAWEGRLKQVTTMYRRSSRYRGSNETEALISSLKPITEGVAHTNPIQLRALLQLSGLSPGDVTNKGVNRLRSMIDFLKMNEGLESAELMDLLESIDDSNLRATAKEISRMRLPRRRPLKVV